MSAKCPKPLVITGVTSLSTSLYQQTFRKIHYTLTDQIIHTLKMSLCASVCNNTVVMWPLFIEVIVSFCIKNTGKIYVTQGKHREFHFSYSVATLACEWK